MSWLANNGEYDAGGNQADVEGRGDWLAEHPDPDYDYDHDDRYCGYCGLELRRNTQTGRCRACGDKGGVA